MLVVTNLSKQTSTTASSIVDVNIVILPVDRLFDKWLLYHDPIDDDCVPVRPQEHIPILGHLILLLLPFPSIRNDHFAPLIFIFRLVSRQHQAEFPPYPLPQWSRDARSAVSGDLCSFRCGHADVIQDG